MTLNEYKDAISKLYVQASTDLALAMVTLPEQRDDRSRGPKHHEYQKMNVLVENLRGTLEKLSGV